MINEGVVSAYFSGMSVFLLVGLMSVLTVILVLMILLGPRKSQNYRKLLSDLYVAGKIKEFATEDKIDLDVENEKFKRWVKKQNIVDKDVDSVVMEELKEKIAESSYDKTTKK